MTRSFAEGITQGLGGIDQICVFTDTALYAEGYTKRIIGIYLLPLYAECKYEPHRFRQAITTNMFPARWRHPLHRIITKGSLSLLVDYWGTEGRSRDVLNAVGLSVEGVI